MLFYTNMAIDTIQNAKNTFLDTYIKDKSFKDPLKSFVEAQRDFTKQVAKSISDITKTCTEYDYMAPFKPAK